MAYEHTKLELIECIGFNQPPKGLCREVVQQIISDLQITFSTYEREGRIRMKVERPTNFNPEAIGAARIFMRDVSNNQFDGTRNINPPIKTDQEPMGLHQTKGSGGWVHLASLVELMKGIRIRDLSDIPFYLRALTRLVPWAPLHAILAYGAMVESDAVSFQLVETDAGPLTVSLGCPADGSEVGVPFGPLDGDHPLPFLPSFVGGAEVPLPLPFRSVADWEEEASDIPLPFCFGGEIILAVDGSGDSNSCW